MAQDSLHKFAVEIGLTIAGRLLKKSSVSRSFVLASAEAVRQLAGRSFQGMRFARILIDGAHYAGEVMVVALGITADKRVLGLRVCGKE